MRKLLVIINNFYLTGVPVFPEETNTPTVIDTDAVLSTSVAAQSFQSVSGWNPQGIKRGRRVQDAEFTQGGTGGISESTAFSAFKQTFSVFVPEADNHILNSVLR